MKIIEDRNDKGCNDHGMKFQAAIDLHSIASFNVIKK